MDSIQRIDQELHDLVEQINAGGHDTVERNEAVYVASEKIHLIIEKRGGVKFFSLIEIKTLLPPLLLTSKSHIEGYNNNRLIRRILIYPS